MLYFDVLLIFVLYISGFAVWNVTSSSS